VLARPVHGRVLALKDTTNPAIAGLILLILAGWFWPHSESEASYQVRAVQIEEPKAPESEDAPTPKYHYKDRWRLSEIDENGECQDTSADCLSRMRGRWLTAAQQAAMHEQTRRNWCRDYNDCNGL
jgi:hypothetical protein